MWTIEFDQRAQRDLAKLDRPIAKRITRFLADRIAPSPDPRAFGKPSNTLSLASGVTV